MHFRLLHLLPVLRQHELHANEEHQHHQHHQPRQDHYRDHAAHDAGAERLLDGTANFLHGIRQFAISIGPQREGTIIAGVIYNPANDELYIAERGKGAFLNDQRLRVAAAAGSTNA